MSGRVFPFFFVSYSLFFSQKYVQKEINSFKDTGDKCETCSFMNIMFCSVEKTQLYRYIWILMLDYWIVTFNKCLINTPQHGTQFQVYITNRFFDICLKFAIFGGN